MRVQNRVAKDHGLSFYQTAAEIRSAVDAGTLVRLDGNADYAVASSVEHPFTHPTSASFVERIARQYRAACGNHW